VTNPTHDSDNIFAVFLCLLVALVVYGVAASFLRLIF